MREVHVEKMLFEIFGNLNGLFLVYFKIDNVFALDSNYLLEIYRVTIGGSTIAVNPQMTEISANSEINSPCVSDLCNINTRPLYKYTIDVSTSCCPKNTANSIEVLLLIWFLNLFRAFKRHLSDFSG